MFISKKKLRYIYEQPFKKNRDELTSVMFVRKKIRHTYEQPISSLLIFDHFKKQKQKLL